MAMQIGGCSKGSKDAAADQPAAASGPSFAGDIQPIFDANCVTCHQAKGASGGLNLESGSAFKSIVLVKSGESPLLYVSPGKPEESYLIHKLEGTHIKVGGSGERMPLAGSLEQPSVDAIRNWVKAGAPEN
jgi:mono/diheme cytochrome c family protein